MNMVFESESDLPHLYSCANLASINAQSKFLISLGAYITTLIIASIVGCYFSSNPWGAIASAILFLVSLSLVIWNRISKQESLWYNGRAVAESIKTRSWRWMMQADPYQNSGNIEIESRRFINDQRAILDQNRAMAKLYTIKDCAGTAIPETMKNVRARSTADRVAYYLKNRINDQSHWYAKKHLSSKKSATKLFVAAIILHGLAVVMLLLKIRYPNWIFPIGTISTGASGIITWLQARRYNELSASYLLATQEIALIKGEIDYVYSEEKFSEFVVNAEQAFSREHTQWAARKNE